MKSVFKSEYFQEKTVIRVLPPNLKTDLIQEKNIVINHVLIQGKTKEVLLDGIKVDMRSGQIKPPVFIEVEHDFPYLKMHFEIEGSSRYTPKNKQSVGVYIPGGHYNFFFLPKVKGTLVYESTSRRTLEIVFTKTYLKRIFGDSFKDASSDFGQAIEQNKPFLMWEQGKPITPQLHVIIEKIVNCSFDASIKKAYLESKITEILTIFFDDLKNKRPEKYLNKDDYRKILHAENVIKKNIQTPPTIPELSFIVGINQSKLKQNFKLIFGKPIFSYLTDIRMEKAKKLIIEKNYTIAEAAYEIGYKNPQHFTTAFKRKYNYLPSSLKRV